MFEAIYTAIQTVNANEDIQLQNSIKCPKHRVLLREGSGIITLKGPSSCCPCNQFFRYQVTLNGNMAVPTTGTLGPINVAIMLNGGEIQSSIAENTPTVVDAYGNFSVTAAIDVPNGCCGTISFRNISASGTAINTKNVNVVINQKN